MLTQFRIAEDDSMPMNPDRRQVYQGRVLSLALESVTLPGGPALELEVIHHPGGAAVVALDDHERVCLLRQYRHAAGDWLWELPAGRLDPGEAPALTAQRELEEETGIRAAHWERLGRMIPTPGYCDEVVHLYLARELQLGQASPAADELIEVHWLPVSAAQERVYTGEIVDAKTMLGLLLCTRLLHP